MIFDYLKKIDHWCPYPPNIHYVVGFLLWREKRRKKRKRK
jgi:hypothetical protein